MAGAGGDERIPLLREPTSSNAINVHAIAQLWIKRVKDGDAMPLEEIKRKPGSEQQAAYQNEIIQATAAWYQAQYNCHATVKLTTTVSETQVDAPAKLSQVLILDTPVDESSTDEPLAHSEAASAIEPVTLTLTATDVANILDEYQKIQGPSWCRRHGVFVALAVTGATAITLGTLYIINMTESSSHGTSAPSNDTTTTTIPETTTMTTTTTTTPPGPQVRFSSDSITAFPFPATLLNTAGLAIDANGYVIAKMALCPSALLTNSATETSMLDNGFNNTAQAGCYQYGNVSPEVDLSVAVPAACNVQFTCDGSGNIMVSVTTPQGNSYSGTVEVTCLLAEQQFALPQVVKIDGVVNSKPSAVKSSLPLLDSAGASLPKDSTNSWAVGGGAFVLFTAVAAVGYAAYQYLTGSSSKSNEDKPSTPEV